MNETKTRRYIGKCQNCKAVTASDAPLVSGMFIRCRNDDGWALGESVRGTLRPEIPCSGKCVNARRSSCDCSCGGENHGAGHLS